MPGKSRSCLKSNGVMKHSIARCRNKRVPLPRLVQRGAGNIHIAVATLRVELLRVEGLRPGLAASPTFLTHRSHFTHVLHHAWRAFNSP
eukprot:SAG11_NODE_527_length_8731_cov_3.883457_9_plen_89_part_00